MTTAHLDLPCEVHGLHVADAADLPPSELANCWWEAHGPDTEEEAEAKARARSLGEAIAQDFRDMWDQIAADFRQSNDLRLREAVSVHVGGLKREFEEAARISDRTIHEDVRYELGLALRPRLDNLIATADADQLRFVVHGMTIGLPDDDFDDDCNDDFVDWVRTLTREPKPTLPNRPVVATADTHVATTTSTAPAEPSPRFNW